MCARMRAEGSRDRPAPHPARAEAEGRMAVRGLVCRECGQRFPAEAIFVCESCFGPLEVEYDLDGVRGKALRERIAGGPGSIWRYQDLLPVPRVPEWDLSPVSPRSSGPTGWGTRWGCRTCI